MPPPTPQPGIRQHFGASQVLSTRLSSSEFKERVLNTVVAKYPYIDRFLEAAQAAGVQLTLSHILPVLGRLTPRYYSIASSHRVHPTTPHIAVRVLRDRTKADEPIYGVCSHYLASLRVLPNPFQQLPQSSAG